jgi:cell division protein FtsW (lipid II flippase)
MKDFMDKYFWWVMIAAVILAFAILKMFFKMTTGNAIQWVAIGSLISCCAYLGAFGYAMYGVRDKHVSTKKG